MNDEEVLDWLKQHRAETVHQAELLPRRLNGLGEGRSMMAKVPAVATA
jgi:hypothetical protein